MYYDDIPQETPKFNPTESLNSFNMFLLVQEESTRQLDRLFAELDTLTTRLSVVRADIRKYERLLSDGRS